MPDSVEFKYSLNKEEYIRAQRSYQYFERGGRTAWVALAFGLSIITVVGVAQTINDGGPRSGFLFVAGAILLVTLIISWIMRIAMRKAASESPYVGIEFEVKFSMEGLIARSSIGTSETRWVIYTSARETTEFILLCSGTNLFYPFPKTAISEESELQRFRDLIRTNVSKVKLLDQSKGK